MNVQVHNFLQNEFEFFHCMHDLLIFLIVDIMMK
jgi:hypothetical protein